MKIYLPEAESAEKEVQAEVHSVARATGSETILLVEDEQSVRDLARAVLERSGYAVLSVCDGEEALSTSQEHGGDIQLLITARARIGRTHVQADQDTTHLRLH